MLVGRVTAVAPPPIPFSLLVDSNCIYGAPPLFENSIKILCKEGGREEGLAAWLAEVARPLDRQFWRLGEQQKVKLAAENK